MPQMTTSMMKIWMMMTFLICNGTCHDLVHFATMMLQLPRSVWCKGRRRGNHSHGWRRLLLLLWMGQCRMWTTAADNRKRWMWFCTYVNHWFGCVRFRKALYFEVELSEDEEFVHFDLCGGILCFGEGFIWSTFEFWLVRAYMSFLGGTTLLIDSRYVRRRILVRVKW